MTSSCFLPFFIGLGMFKRVLLARVYELQMPKERLHDQARASIFSCRTILSLKCAVHILFIVKDAFQVPKRF